MLNYISICSKPSSEHTLTNVVKTIYKLNQLETTKGQLKTEQTQ